MRTKLITAELEERFAHYPLYKQDGLSREAICVCCFYIGHIRWYALEGQPEKGDFTIFGIVVGMGQTEYGYSCIREMEEIAIDHPMFPTPLRIEQAPSICNVPIGSIEDKELQRFLDYMAE